MDSQIFISHGGVFYNQYLPIINSPDNSNNDFNLNRFIFGDFNGDGKTDFLKIGNSTRSCVCTDQVCTISTPTDEPNEMYLSNVDTGTGNYTFTKKAGPVLPKYYRADVPPENCLIIGLPPTWLLDPNYLGRIKTGDFNGDGKTDILLIRGNTNTLQPSRIYFATGSGNSITFTTADGPSFTMSNMDSSDDKREDAIYLQRIRVADFNADGKSDIHMIHNYDALTPSTVFFSSYQNNAYSFQSATGPSFTISHGDSTCGEKQWAFYDLARIRYGDFNGDGKTDILLIRPNTYSHIYFATGNTLQPFDETSGRTKGPIFYINTSEYKFASIDLQRIKAGDFNGDKRTDLAVQGGWGGTAPMSIYLATDSGFSYTESLNKNGATHTFFVGTDSSDDPDNCMYYALLDVSKFLLGDFKGNGKTGFVYLEGRSLVDAFLYNAKPDITDLIQGVTAGSLAIDFEYNSSAQFDNRQLPFAIPVLSSMTVDPAYRYNDPAKVVSQTIYEYGDGYYDTAEGEFRGFAYTKQTNADETTLETWHHQRDAVDSNGVAVDWADLKGKPYRVEFSERWSGNTPGNLLSSTDMVWEKRAIVSPSTYPFFISLKSKSITSIVGGVTVSSSEVYEYDQYGNITKVTSSGPGAPAVITENAYWKDTTAWLFRKARTAVSGNSTGSPSTSPVKTRETTFGYQSGTGNMLWKAAWLYGGSNPTVSFQYTTEGNIEYEWDPKNSATKTNGKHTTYDQTKTFPVTVQYPTTGGVTHEVEYSYDKRFGVVIWSKDENLNETCTTTDGFGRIKMTQAFEGSCATGKLAAKSLVVYNDSSYPKVVTSKVLESKTTSGAETYIDKLDYFDGLGRNIQTITFGEAGKSIVTSNHYDNMGRVDMAYGPYFSSGTGYPHQLPASGAPWTYTVYNSFGKPIEVTRPDIEYSSVTARISYSGLTTTVTDPDGKQKTEKKDFLGRTYEVIEYPEEGAKTTQYVYDPAGGLLSTTDSKGSMTRMTYDTLGRKTTMQDPDMGCCWQYTYDQNGNLTSQTDAKNQTITFTYDALNRVKTKTYSTTDPAVTYTYDDPSVTNGKGRLASENNTLVDKRIFAYDALGKVLSSSKMISGNPVSYMTETKYDFAGKPVWMKYPGVEYSGAGGFSLTYTYYPGTGLLYQVRGSDGVTYSLNSAYEPTGKMGQLNYGNGTATRYSYDPTSTKLMGMVTEPPITTQPDIVYRTYSYTPAGDIKRILNNDISDATPNNLTGSAIFSYTYGDPNHVHAVTGIKVNGGAIYNFVYDANGNMTEGYDLSNPLNPRPRTIAYNADNKPIEITYQGSITRYLYDGEGVRAKKAATSGSTYYIGDHFEVVKGKEVMYVFAGNLRIAKVTSAGIYYYHKDHLGSSVAVTDQTGAIVEVSKYAPFGEQEGHSGASTSNYLYTDQEFDPETGLYDYGARFYDPTLGRFISPDSVVQDPYDPQTLNRYSYCRNNPLIYTDPSGHFFFVDDILIGAAIGAILGGTTSAITGGNVLQGMLLGAVSGAVFAGVSGVVGESIAHAGIAGGIGPPTAGAAAAGQIGGGIAGGAAAGAASSAISGSNIGQGALVGGIMGGLGSLGSPNFEPFGSSATNEAASMGNRLFNSAVTGAAFGATYAGVTGGNIGQGAAMGAAGWAAGEAANMMIGRVYGSIVAAGREFRDGAAFYYRTDGSVPFSIGGVVIGDADWIWYGTKYNGWVPAMPHELAHATGRQRTLGPSYIPAHALTQGLSGFIGVLTGQNFWYSTHDYNIFEKSWVEVPAQ